MAAGTTMRLAIAFFSTEDGLAEHAINGMRSSLTNVNVVLDDGW
jgi:hypothetical protein